MANPLPAELMLPLLPDSHIYSFPKEREKASPIHYFPLSEILTKSWTTDAHFTAYSMPAQPYRLSRDAVTLEGGVVMVAIIFDCDCELAHAATGGHGDVPAPDEWWISELPKLEALEKEVPGIFAYRTRGGYRCLGRLPVPIFLDSDKAVQQWKHTYLAWCVALRRRFGIYADPSCHDWQRLFRAPHATRIPGGRSEHRETRGNPEVIGVWTLEPTDEEQADAWLIAKRPRAPRDSGRESTSAMPIGDGVLFHAFSSRGWVGKVIEPGKWAVQCPWDSSHSKGTLFDTSTVLFAPGTGETLGWWHCSHAHCQRRDLRDVLALFSDPELDQAKAAAGILPPLRAVNTPIPIPQAPQESKTLTDVIQCFQHWMDLPDTGFIEILLGAYAANQIPGDPAWVLGIGPSSSGKTEPLTALMGLPHTHMVSTLTEGSLLSGTPRREKVKEAKGGLLREIGDFGYLICKDFTSVLSIQEKVRGPILAALREIYDGRWDRPIGVDGGRVLSWTGKAVILGGCTDAIDNHYVLMASMGQRFFLFRLPPIDAHAQAAKAFDGNAHEVEMRQELRAVVQAFMTGRDFTHIEPTATPAMREHLIQLAMLTVVARSPIERDGHTREITLIPDPEAPARAVKVMGKLWAALRGIGVSDQRAWVLVRKMGLDSMPKLRRSVFGALGVTDEPKTTAELAIALDHPTQTTRRALEDLSGLKLVQRIKIRGKKGDLWLLSDEARKRFDAIPKTIDEHDFH